MALLGNLGYLFMLPNFTIEYILVLLNTLLILIEMVFRFVKQLYLVKENNKVTYDKVLFE